MVTWSYKRQQMQLCGRAERTASKRGRLNFIHALSIIILHQGTWQIMLSPVLLLSVQKKRWMNISLRGLALPQILVPKFINLFLVGWIYCSEKAIPEGNTFFVSLPCNSEFFLFLNKLFLLVLIIAAAAALPIQIDHRNMSKAELWHKKRLQVRGFCTISFWFARPSTQASHDLLHWLDVAKVSGPVH
jgi:hypothetical protein